MSNFTISSFNSVSPRAQVSSFTLLNPTILAYLILLPSLCAVPLLLYMLLVDPDLHTTIYFILFLSRMLFIHLLKLYHFDISHLYFQLHLPPILSTMFSFLFLNSLIWPNSSFHLLDLSWHFCCYVQFTFICFTTRSSPFHVGFDVDQNFILSPSARKILLI